MILSGDVPRLFQLVIRELESGSGAVEEDRSAPGE